MARREISDLKPQRDGTSLTENAILVRGRGGSGRGHIVDIP
jgi:hypothetical protein